MKTVTTTNSSDIDFPAQPTFTKADRERYEKDLEKRKREHLQSLQDNMPAWRPCLHDGCPECVGTGIKKDGSSCMHMISCPCPKCTPFSM